MILLIVDFFCDMPYFPNQMLYAANVCNANIVMLIDIVINWFYHS